MFLLPSTTENDDWNENILLKYSDPDTLQIHGILKKMVHII
jgi:hypothetical protein